MKVTVVGSGFVGATTTMRIAHKGLADEVVMVDIVEGLPQGLALDMNQSAPIEGFEPVVRGTNDYADTAASDVVVITAGLPRQPGMSRMDLLEKNAGIMREVAGQVRDTSPGAVVVVVSNPLDEMTFLAAEVTGFPRERVIGMAGTLDSSRLRYFIAEELGVSPRSVEAVTLGSHGESMVPLPGQATVEGKPLRDLVDDQTLERLYQRTRDAGAEIVQYL
ncbi:MAG TPA: malate dehydrogenase, partial [Actinomycetota bacterium]|nr:malate dehydrogenase [Actinomycetota bacterium]